MIDRFTHQDLRKLVEFQNPPCVSIFLPTQKTGREIYKSKTRLMNLAKAARQKLAPKWMSDEVADKFLNPIQELAGDDEFWQVTDQGLAVFIDVNGLRYWRVAHRLEEQVFVSQQFFVRPMIAVQRTAGTFFILALSRKIAKLFEANSSTISVVDVPNMPGGIEEALDFASVERGSQAHTGSREFGGKGSTIFHGQGGKPDSATDDLRSYFRLVSDAVTDYLKDQPGPLVLACVENHFPIFKDINSYSLLLDDVIAGSPDRVNPAEFQAKGKQIFAVFADKKRQAALKSFVDNAHTNRTLSETSAIVAAAHQGRVDRLLVDNTAKLPGRFEPSNQSVQYEVAAEDGDVDLIEDVIAQTLAHKGEVYVFDADEMPIEQPIVATVRF
jgi:hypothetical protein